MPFPLPCEESLLPAALPEFVCGELPELFPGPAFGFPLAFSATVLPAVFTSV